MELLIEVTRWDPPSQMGFKILNTQFPVESTEYVYRLATEDGGTRVTLDGEFEMVGVLRFAGGWMGKMYTKSNGHELNTAKKLLEAG